MSHIERKTLQSGYRIKDYTIISLIGQGGFGDVYKVSNSKGSLFAMKTEYKNATKKALSKEIEILTNLNMDGVPKVYDHGEKTDFLYLVMDLFGPSISSYRKKHNNIIPNRYIYFLAYEMLKLIQAFHHQGYVHRDIKPSNFLFQKNSKHPLVLIDFGLAKPYIDLSTNQILPPNEKARYIGTKKYASINSHRNHDLGRCDDLVSWFYSVYELIEKLPWRNVNDNNVVLDMKTNFEINIPSSNFGKIYSYISKLQFNDTPNYGLIFSNLNTDMYSFGFDRTNMDWVVFYNNEIKDNETDDNQPKNENSIEYKQNNCCLIQ